MKENNKATLGLLICLVLSIIMIIYIVINFRVDNVSLNKGAVNPFPAEWVENLEYSNHNYNVKMSNKIPEIGEIEEAIYLKTYHQTLEIYVDHECIYTYGTDVSVTFGNSVASAIHLVPLKQEYSGKPITVYLSSYYKKNGRLIPEVLLGNERSLIYYILQEHVWLLIETTAMFVIAIALILFWLSSRKAVYANNSFLHLGLSVLLITTWFVSNSQIFGLFFGNVTVIMYICYMSFFLIPVPVLLYFEKAIGHGFRRAFHILEYLGIGYFLVAYVLQFLNIVNFKQLLSGVHIQLVLMLFLFAYIAYNRFRDGTVKRHRRHMVYCVCISLLMVFVDMVRYYVSYGSDVASLTRVGLIIYVLGLVTSMIMDSFDSIALAKEASIYEKLAYTDRLTGLFNRTAYENDLKELNGLMKTNAAHFNRSIIVVCFDLNNLKKINDTQGHKQGDSYIRIFSKIAKDIFRNYGSIYRTGGDEFVALLYDIDISDAEQMVNSMNNTISEYNNDLQKKFRGIPFSVAVGITKYQVGIDQTIQDVIERCDHIMYQNKVKMKAAGKDDKSTLLTANK